jgi:hypothetical protein
VARYFFGLLDNESGNPRNLKAEYSELKTHATSRGKDPLGAITYAELIVAGTVVAVPTGHAFTRKRGPKPQGWERRPMPYPDGHVWNYAIDWNFERELQNTEGLKMVVLGSFDLDSNQRVLAGLLIYGIGVNDERRYKRVGVFRSVDGDQLPNSVERFCPVAVSTGNPRLLTEVKFRFECGYPDPKLGRRSPKTVPLVSGSTATYSHLLEALQPQLTRPTACEYYLTPI